MHRNAVTLLKRLLWIVSLLIFTIPSQATVFRPTHQPMQAYMMTPHREARSANTNKANRWQVTSTATQSGHSHSVIKSPTLNAMVKQARGKSVDLAPSFTSFTKQTITPSNLYTYRLLRAQPTRSNTWWQNLFENCV